MGKLLKGFKILCTDLTICLEKSGENIQGGILIKEIRYSKIIAQETKLVITKIVHTYKASVKY